MRTKIFRIIYDVIVAIFVLVLFGGGIAMPIVLAVNNQEPLYLFLYILVAFVWFIFFIGIKKR